VRLKIPWRKPKGIEAEPPTLVSAVAAEEHDQRGQDSARGAEILETSNVETVELGPLAKLPPFRPVVISLVRLFDRHDVKIEEVAALVQSDPSMASELLGVANSPLFGLQQLVLSPLHAIALLGVDLTKSLAATLALRSLMQGAPRTPVVRRFWVHSIATATIARHFANSLGIEPELCHVAALMHDLGRSGLLAAHPERYVRLALAAHENTEEILAAEQSEFGMTHCHAGTLLAKAWSLPEPFGVVAGHHHETSSDLPVVALVQLCCRLADDFMYQAIHRTDIQKPEETIAQYAPEPLRELFTSQLEAVSAAIDTAIQTLDF
jgi:putative nucleotidyltransferase with HDIG domain